MTRSHLIFGSLWLVSVAAAFVIGSFKPGSGASSADSHSVGTSASRPVRANEAAPASRSRTSLRDSGGPSHRIVTSLSPEQAVTELAQLSNPLERSRGILALIDRLEPHEFQAVLSEFRALGITNERLAEYQLLLTAWAKVNPEEALTYARENTGGSFARGVVLRTWAREDLQSAIAWADQVHEGEGANPWMVGIIEGVVEVDPTRAGQLTEALPYSRERGRALDAVVDSMVRADPDQAKSWALTIEDERLQTGAIANVAEELSRSAPSDAAAWLAATDNVEAQQRAAEDVGERLADYDMDAAMDWANDLSPAARGNALEGVVDRLVDEDPIRAAEWLASMQDPEINLDGAIGELIRGSTSSDPYLAATWVAGIEDERNRMRYYHRVLGDWMRRDAPAATDFMQVNGVPESVRRRYLRTEGNNR